MEVLEVRHPVVLLREERPFKALVAGRPVVRAVFVFVVFVFARWWWWSCLGVHFIVHHRCRHAHCDLFIELQPPDRLVGQALRLFRVRGGRTFGCGLACLRGS